MIQDQLLNLLWFFTELRIKVFCNRFSSQREIRENRCSRFLPVVAICIDLDTQPHCPARSCHLYTPRHTATLSQNASLLRVKFEHCTQRTDRTGPSTLLLGIVYLRNPTTHPSIFHFPFKPKSETTGIGLSFLEVGHLHCV
jgi:hypothetical protein